MAAGTELCPHCQRPFKRLRAHLPHCKAAPPAPAPGPAPGPQPGTAPAQPPAPGRAPGPRSRSPAVQDVARSLDLHPEEVQEVPRQLRKGPRVVIEQLRARVLREKRPRGPAERTEPGTAAPTQRPETAQKSKSNETRSQGAAGSGTASSKGENLKATKALRDSPESRNSRGELGQQEGKDKFTAGEEQVQVEFGVGSKPPLAALHPKKLHLSPMEAIGGDGQGTPKNELSSRQRLRDGGEGVSEPGLNAGRAPELHLLHTAKIQSAGATARGLEWFPDLYPAYEGLRMFPGKRFHEDLRIGAETPKGGFTRGQQGPLSERPLMEVRLGELHSWIRTCSFSPQGLLGAVQKAWSSYCARYIHVKQGGPAGISMLLAGYCLFSYGWNYQHFKRHRWRKYH